MEQRASDLPKKFVGEPHVYISCVISHLRTMGGTNFACPFLPLFRSWEGEMYVHNTAPIRCWVQQTFCMRLYQTRKLLCQVILCGKVCNQYNPLHEQWQCNQILLCSCAATTGLTEPQLQTTLAQWTLWFVSLEWKSTKLHDAWGHNIRQALHAQPRDTPNSQLSRRRRRCNTKVGQETRPFLRSSHLALAAMKASYTGSHSAWQPLILTNTYT